jgi:chromosomal replication initiation ATPase DnaA
MFVARTDRVDSNPITQAAIQRQLEKQRAGQGAALELEDQIGWYRRELAHSKSRQIALQEELTKTQKMIKRMFGQMNNYLSGDVSPEEPQASEAFSLRYIMVWVARLYGVPVVAINSNSRESRVTLARHAYFYWARQLTDCSYPEIGVFAGGKDHTTVLHGERVYLGKRRKYRKSKKPLNTRWWRL